ncbi:polysaccharide transporter, PST family [Sphingobacterium nematocida]|uniref:Polysaccharide transporter, PST family n=1 Tax=Sphingobacterium nematocida TaxID=1513896 RepID=A0A1T5EXW3_9SPHI|nr:O-antigen translocase [Sphingobacterium nematocida]SKB88777.1 polysaccharide transporter, PST family [Sphingobacterium nematocida]
MKLLSTSVFSAIITFVKISASFAASKVIAYFSGPIGVAVIGQFYSLTSIIVGFSNGGISTGVVKFTSEFEGNKFKQQQLISTALKLSSICAFFLSILVVCFSEVISKSLFESKNFKWPIVCFGLTLIFYAFNNVIISIINGKKQIKLYALVNCIGSIASLILTVFLVYRFKIVGALYALVVSQVTVFFITLWCVRKQEWLNLDIFKIPISKQLLSSLGQYSIMALVAAISLPLTQLILRNIIIQNGDLFSAGLWQGLIRISDGYLMIVTISLSTYFVPKLAGASDYIAKSEILNGYKIVLPFLIVVGASIYFLRFFVIRVLYTDDFFGMSELFVFQLVGDFIKIIGFFLGTLMVVRKLTRAYLFSEIAFNIIYISLSYYLVKINGLIGITYAYSISYSILLLYFLIFFRKLLFSKHEKY